MSDTLPQACVETDAFLVELAYGEESSVPAAALEHLRSCERCTRELRELTRVRAAASALPLEEPSAAMDDAIFAALDAHFAPPQPAPKERPQIKLVSSNPAPEPRRETKPARPRGWMWSSFAAAASIALVAGGTLLIHKSSPSTAVFNGRREAVADYASAPAEAAPVATPIAAKDAEGKAKPDANEPAQKIQQQMQAPPVVAHLGVAGPNAPGNLKAETSKGVGHVAKKAAKSPGFSQLNGLGALAGSGGDSGDTGQGAPLSLRSLSQNFAGAGASAPPRGGEALADKAPESPPATVAPSALAKEEQKVVAEAPRAPPPPPVAAAAPVAAPPPAPSAVADNVAPEVPPAEAAAAAPEAMDAPAPAPQREADTRERREKKAGPTWKELLAQAQSALDHGRYAEAEAGFARVLARSDLPDSVTDQALQGRIRALHALGREPEARRAQAMLTARALTNEKARRALDEAAPAKAAKPAADKAPADVPYTQ